MALSCISARQQDNNSFHDPELYLIKKVLLMKSDTGSIIIIPLKTKEIRHYNTKNEVKFWNILEKYFSGMSKENLSTMVSEAPWLNKSIALKGFNIYFPSIKPNEILNLRDLSKQYGYSPIFSISNIIYTKDRNTCIIYVSSLDDGSFTVEIKKDINGKWASHTKTSEWLK
jgi:hypothetical protein